MKRLCHLASTVSSRMTTDNARLTVVTEDSHIAKNELRLTVAKSVAHSTMVHESISAQLLRK